MVCLFQMFMVHSGFWWCTIQDTFQWLSSIAPAELSQSTKEVTTKTRTSATKELNPCSQIPCTFYANPKCPTRPHRPATPETTSRGATYPWDTVTRLGQTDPTSRSHILNLLPLASPQDLSRWLSYMQCRKIDRLTDRQIDR